MKRSAALIVLILVPLTVTAQPVGQADLALRARSILKTHCGACHTAGAEEQRGELSIAARTEMDRPDRLDRPFLVPGKPNDSQIIDLIEAGNMPPGNRPKVSRADLEILRAWISADAPGYPKDFNDDYVVDALVADFKRHSPEEQTLTRYLSLAHLVHDDTTTLQPKRDDLLRSVRDLSKPEATIEAVDLAQTVFRIDLRRMGWEVKPFGGTKYTTDDQGEIQEEEIPSNLNFFDLILLEYPLGQVYPKASAVVARFNAVRPVPFVRGDWLVDVFAKLRIAKEVKPKVSGTDHFWPHPAPRTKIGPIPPWDAVSQPEYTSTPAPFNVTFESIDPAVKAKKTSFKKGDLVYLTVKSDKAVYIEVVMGDESGETEPIWIQRLGPNITATKKPKYKEGFSLNSVGTGTFILYASTTPFPTVVRHRDPRLTAWLAVKETAKKTNQPAPKMTGEWIGDRLVHPAWTVEGPVKDFDPTQIIKRTIEIEVK